MGIWILVADSKQAKIFSEERRGEIILVHELKSKSTEEENNYNALGRSFESGADIRHIIEPHTDPVTKHLDEFSLELANCLQEFLERKLYTKLVLIAPPKMLGHLRSKLPHAVYEKIIKELDLELIHFSQTELKKILEKEGV